MSARTEATVVVAQLPAAAPLGTIYEVTDATSVVAKGATVTGGGTSKCLVCWNNTNWVGV
jgi:hypothetical protein